MTYHYFPSSFVAEPADARGLTAVTIRRTIRARIGTRWEGEPFPTVTVHDLMGDEHDGTRPVADATVFTVSGMSVRHTPPDDSERRQVRRGRRLDVTTGTGDQRTGDLTIWHPDGTAVTVRQHHERRVVASAYRERYEDQERKRSRARSKAKREAAKRARAEREREHQAKLAKLRDQAKRDQAKREHTNEWAGR